MESYVVLYIFLVILSGGVLYKQVSPTQRMLKKLRKGALPEALNYFWEKKQYDKIKHYLDFKLSLPTAGFWGTYPNFRKQILETYENAVRLQRLQKESESLLPVELQVYISELLTHCTKSLWQSCHRLSILTPNVDKRSIKPALKDISEDIKTMSNLLLEATRTTGDFVARSSRSERLEVAKDAMKLLVQKAKDQLEAEEYSRKRLSSSAE
jgi:hypothetical protein